MALRSVEEYRTSLIDGRRVVYRGESVENVATHPILGRTVDHAADLYAMRAGDDAGLTSYMDEELGEQVSAYFRRPRTPEQLRARGDLIEHTTRRCGTTLNIIQAVGTDALLGLERALAGLQGPNGDKYRERVAEFRADCARGDLAMALAATDPKGDRSLSPIDQSDPDSYLRVVARDADGINVRGAKVHTTASPSANELICIPCRALKPEEGDYAVAFAVPLDAPGLTLIAHPLVDGPRAEQPVSGRHIEVETLTVFDDVFVPWERVFLCGETEFAGAVATSFALYHRYTALSYKPPAIDLLIGAVILAAEQLGIRGAAHVREKLGRLVVYCELIRAARVAAAVQAPLHPTTGLVEPYALAANAGKYHFASGYHEMVALVQDVAGGLTVTAPGFEDLESPIVGATVAKYLAGADGDGRARWRLVQLIRDMTASEFGGYNYVVTLHGEGSQQAQLVQTLREADLDDCVHLARGLLDEADRSVEVVRT